MAMYSCPNPKARKWNRYTFRYGNWDRQAFLQRRTYSRPTPSRIVIKEYLSRLAARVETNGPAGYEQRNLGLMCHALVCRRTEPAESTMP